MHLIPGFPATFLNSSPGSPASFLLHSSTGFPTSFPHSNPGFPTSVVQYFISWVPASYFLHSSPRFPPSYFLCSNPVFPEEGWWKQWLVIWNQCLWCVCCASDQVCYLFCTSLPVREVCLHLTCIGSVFRASVSVLMSCASSWWLYLTPLILCRIVPLTGGAVSAFCLKGPPLSSRFATSAATWSVCSGARNAYM